MHKPRGRPEVGVRSPPRLGAMSGGLGSLLTEARPDFTAVQGPPATPEPLASTTNGHCFCLSYLDEFVQHFPLNAHPP